MKASTLDGLWEFVHKLFKHGHKLFKNWASLWNSLASLPWLGGWGLNNIVVLWWYFRIFRDSPKNSGKSLTSEFVDRPLSSVGPRCTYLWIRKCWPLPIMLPIRSFLPGSCSLWCPVPPTTGPVGGWGCDSGCSLKWGHEWKGAWPRVYTRGTQKAVMAVTQQWGSRNLTQISWLQIL